MDETAIYQDLLVKIKDIKNNLNDASYNLRLFSQNAESALKINDSTSYKQLITSVKSNLDYRITQLEDVIIPEIQSKI